MPSYKKEFPDFDRDLKIPEGFEDKSWHNDTCPSFHHVAFNMVLFVDYADPELREFPESPAFSLCSTDEIGARLGAFGSDDDDLGYTDDWDEMLAMIATHAKDPERQRRLDIQRQAEGAGFTHDSEWVDKAHRYFWAGDIDGRKARIGAPGMKSAFPEAGERWDMSVEFPESGVQVGIEVDDFASAVEAARIAVAQVEASASPKH